MVESKITQKFSSSPHDRAQHAPSRLWLIALVALWIPTGCSKEERKKMATTFQQQAQKVAEKTQQYTQAAVEAVEEKLPASGSITLRMDPPVELNRASARIIRLGEGRGNVVQLSNYELEDGPETYPSLLIQGTTEVETVSSLAGQTVICDFYLRTSTNEPILMSSISRPVQVNFDTYDEKSNTCLLYTSPSPRDATLSRMPSSA